VCSGYRDPLTLTFRNQTEDVTVKYGGRNDHAGSKPVALKSNFIGSIDASIAAHSLPRKMSPFSDLRYRELYIPIEEQATCFFFQNYILDDFIGYYSYIPNVYGTLPAGCALAEAITSLGMAGIANSKKDTRLMINASLKYTSALRTINIALRDPYEAKRDQTLVAVMLLGLFEVRHFTFDVTFTTSNC
jgi:hypothetical protein